MVKNSLYDIYMHKNSSKQAISEEPITADSGKKLPPRDSKKANLVKFMGYFKVYKIPPGP